MRLGGRLAWFTLSRARVILVSQSVSGSRCLSVVVGSAAAAPSQPFQPDLAQIPTNYPDTASHAHTLLCFACRHPRLTSPALALGNSNHLVKETPRDQHPPTIDLSSLFSLQGNISIKEKNLQKWCVTDLDGNDETTTTTAATVDRSRGIRFRC